MKTTATIVYGVAGQELRARCLSGVPTSATFDVFDDDASEDSTPEFSGSATVDSTATTTTALCGYGVADAAAVPCVSVAGFVIGNKYLLRGSGTPGEFFEVVAIEGSTLRARFPISQTHTSGAQVVSTNVSAAVPSLFYDDSNKLGDVNNNAWPDYRVRWTFAFGGDSVVEWGYFDFVRAEVLHGVSIDDVNALAPGLRDSLPTEYRNDAGASLIEAAWHAVQADLAIVGIEANALRDAQITDELVKLRTLVVLAEGGWRPSGVDWQVYAELTRTNYSRFIERHFSIASKHKLGDASGAASAQRSMPVWRR